MNTTYTVIKKCIAKGAIERSEPHFLCRARVTKEEIQKAETNDLINRIFDGSEELLVASLLSGRRLSEAKRDELKRLIDETKE